MVSTWTPEQLGVFEAKIEAARAGDIGEAVSLLRWSIRCLENSWPLPEPLRRYLIAAFLEITKDKSSPDGIRLPPYPVFGNIDELRENLRCLEETGDANAALNLTRPRGRKRTAASSAMHSAALAMMVNHEREKGQSWEQAVGAVADRMGVSERTVSRAWQKMKGLLYGP